MAFRVGLPPLAFWSLTPWQFYECVDVFNDKLKDDHRHRAWLAWHTGVISRIRKIPSLKELIAERRRGMDEAVIKAQFEAYNHRLEANRKGKHG